MAAGGGGCQIQTTVRLARMAICDATSGIERLSHTTPQPAVKVLQTTPLRETNL